MNVIAQFQPPHDYATDRFRATFEGAAIGIGVCRLDGRMMDANPALTRILGYSRQELTGTHARELCPQPGPEGSGTPSQYEHLLGELIHGNRTSFEIENCYRRKDGSELWGHLTVSLGRDAQREPAFLIATLADATERKRLESHLREAEKLEIIGRLAAGIAHDFNNLLTGVLLYCDLMTAALEKAEMANVERTNPGLTGTASRGFVSPVVASTNLSSTNNGLKRSLCQQVEEVRLAGEQGAALTQQLLGIARKQDAATQPVPINEIVASTENLLRRLIGEQIELVTALDSGVGLVLANPAQLRQVLMNLVLNARDAMPQGGKIRLITRAAELPGKFSGEVSGNGERRRARPAVSLAVEDNGCGMDAETRARLFEPFFTTKKEGQGTGLGLPTVQRIVREAGGVIEVQSEPGRGTCVEVLLPAFESPAAESPFAFSPAYAGPRVGP